MFGRLLRRLDELCFVVVYRVLCFELRLVVFPEERHRALRPLAIEAKLEQTTSKAWATRYRKQLKDVTDQLRIYGQQQREIGSQTSMLRTIRSQTRR